MSDVNQQPRDPSGAIPADFGSQACPACGTLLSQICADGFLGCEECYRVFNDVVRQALDALHQTSHHTGKTL